MLRYRRKQDNAARDLGLLIHRRERGGEVEQRRVDALLLRLDDLEKEIGRLESQIAEARRQRAAAQPASQPVEQPVPTSAP
jgi:predicted  nucleic acid-binding Zn-ribbon protein